MRLEAAQAYLLDEGLDARAVGRGGQPARAQAERDVVEDGVPGEERGLLEDDGAARVGRPHGLAVEEDGAAGGRVEAGHHVEQRGLAAPRGPQEGGELVAGHGDAHGLQRFDGASRLVERLRDVAQLDDGAIAHAWASSVRHLRTTRDRSWSARSETKPSTPTDSIVATQMSMRPT